MATSPAISVDSDESDKVGDEAAKDLEATLKQVRNALGVCVCVWRCCCAYICVQVIDVRV